MTQPADIRIQDTDLDAIAGAPGTVTIVVGEDGKLDPSGRRVNKLTKGALKRAVESEAFEKLGAGKSLTMGYPIGMEAEKLVVMKLPKKPDATTARQAGATLAGHLGKDGMTLLVGSHLASADLLYGLALRSYAFTTYKTGDDMPPPQKSVTVQATKPEALATVIKDQAALVEGVFFTRDLTNEPANVLTTDDFAARLAAMQDLGLDVEILDEPELEKLGMRTLLGVGQGSTSGSKVVVMRWNGGGDEAPFALVGKGVVFDTGGISIKPAGGMEAMTMDMGGAGVVAGTMRALALRGAKANVVGLVGLVENMPDGNAQRPGDIVTSMKGDTVEIINTDAEGRLVLADVLWYAQERFKPTGMVDLATLTGAILVALGKDRAGVYANDETLADDFLAAAKAEDEGAWRMPLGPEFTKMMKSKKADWKNAGGRYGGSNSAAAFLQAFVKDDMPWIHLDIAGVADNGTNSYAPEGATGWGVRSLDRLIRDNYEG